MHEQASSLWTHCDSLAHYQCCAQGMVQEEGLKQLFPGVFFPRAAVMRVADFKPHLFAAGQ